MKDEYDFTNAVRGKFFHAVYPGHPIVTAYMISKSFSSFEEASAPTCHGFPRALGDTRIHGAGSSVYAGLRVLQKLRDGEAMDSIVAHAADIWRGETRAHSQEHREDGERQAAQCLTLLDPTWSAPRENGAILDETRTYRYLFWRATGSGTGTCAFLLINPSTADEVVPDNTSKKCLKYARAWGYARMVIVNLFAFRTKDIPVLEKVKDLETAVGRDNDAFIDAVCTRGNPWYADIIVNGWGGHGCHLGRDQVVFDRLRARNVPMHYLKLSKGKRAFPWHPLYLPDALRPQPYAEAA